MTLHKLFDEARLLRELKTDTLNLIHRCPAIEAIEKLVDCHKVLGLTLKLATEYPNAYQNIPTHDRSALIHLSNRARELYEYYPDFLPDPEFPNYTWKIRRLLVVYRVIRTNS